VAASCLEPYRGCIAARFADDPHLEATVLHRELVDAGFGRAYTTLVGELRRLELRPVCLVCAHRRADQVTTEIDHPAGEEIQWDWLELSAADVPWGEPAYVLVGALSYSGRFRGVVCEQMTFGHLARAVHAVLVALGGTPRVWRTDRMATVVSPQTGRITPEAAALAKHYGAQIAVCPARRAQRKGVVEAAIKYLTRSWWRTAAVATMGAAQRDLDAWSARVADRRTRPGGTVGELGAAEPLGVLPPLAYPAQIVVARTVSRAALTAFEGNRYSVPPAHAGKRLTVIAPVAEPVVRITGAHGEIVAEHRRVPAGAGQTVRSAPRPAEWAPSGWDAHVVFADASCSSSPAGDVVDSGLSGEHKASYRAAVMAPLRAGAWIVGADALRRTCPASKNDERAPLAERPRCCVARRIRAWTS
jgi:hypothetical protein